MTLDTVTVDFETGHDVPWWRRPLLLGVVAVVCGILAGNALYLFGITTPDPLKSQATISFLHVPRFIEGLPTIDPNIGYTSQALGHLAAQFLLHGQVPWWNHDEAFGMPLAGEMQSAALFPFTVLEYLPSGQLIFHLTLELIAGLSTFFLVRRFNMAVWACVIAGIAFGLNGTFAWLGNAIVNPIAFLPVILIGIELARDCATSHRRGGWWLIAVGIALSLYAGFPEVAYLNGIFIGIWVIARFSTLPRGVMRAFALKVIAAVGVGAALALPLLVAFADFLKVGFTATHANGGFANASLLHSGMSTVLAPYVYGNPFAFIAKDQYIGNIWGGVGGYVSAALMVFAIVGLFGARERVLRLFLAGWAAFSFCVIFGLVWAHPLFNLLPAIKSIATYRYLDVSFEFSLIVLAAFGIDDLIRRAASLRHLVTGGVIVLVLTTWSVLGAPLRKQLAAVGNVGTFAAAQLILPIVAIVAVTLAAIFLRGAWRNLLVACIICADIIAAFAMPSLSAPRRATVDTAPVAFLQHNLGLGRFYTTGPLVANYGSYFSIASINAADLPISTSFDAYVQSRLDSNSAGFRFNGYYQTDYRGLTTAQAFAKNMANYAAVGVKYVLSPTTLINPTPFGLPVVYRDRLVTISAVPGTASYFQASSGCTVTPVDRDHATVDCTRPGTLVRLEQSMAGWTANVGGVTQTPSTTGSIFQSIALPVGTSTVTYTFLPPHERLAEAAALCALMFLLGSLIWSRQGNGTRAAPKHGRSKLRRSHDDTHVPPIVT